MEFLQPTSWKDALAVKAERPDALPIAGGTDVMVDVNFGRARPESVMDVSRLGELADWGTTGSGTIRFGAGVSYSRVISELGAALPGLAIASRTVGSPQIRNRGTVGGNLGSASPAGDAHPPLLASRAEIEVTSTSETRRIPVTEFFTGPKRSALRPGELIAAVHVPSAAGPQQFTKIGPRNAMVIAVCAFALALDPPRGRVGTGIGAAGPTPLVAEEAERFLQGVLAEQRLWDIRGPLPESVVTQFGNLVGAAARPIDDVRGSASYRTHALAVLARRALTWAWEEYRRGVCD